MEDFHKLSTSIKYIKKEQEDEDVNIQCLTDKLKENRSSLDALIKRIDNLYKAAGFSQDINFQRSGNNTILEEIDIQLHIYFPNDEKTEADKAYDLNQVDVLVACLAGGIATLVDYLMVKTPKNIKIDTVDGRKTIEGSPLTKLLKQIGFDSDNRKEKWVICLEKWFPVNYDASTSEHIKGMYSRNHRIFNLGHDPSVMGLIWGIKDIVCGTFSYIDKDGFLHIDKVNEADVKRLFYAPFLWLGHLLSDVFTKAGLPIPGGCMLRTLRFGSFGEKDRVVGEIIEYMYITGYDLRHLATASICNVVIELVIKTYMFLVGDIKIKNNAVLFEREYNKVKNNHKKHKLLMISYSIAVCGNITKVATYQGAPNAINIPIWYSFVKETMTQFALLSKDSNNTIETIENRNLIDERLEYLIRLSKEL